MREGDIAGHQIAHKLFQDIKSQMISQARRESTRSQTVLSSMKALHNCFHHFIFFGVATHLQSENAVKKSWWSVQTVVSTITILDSSLSSLLFRLHLFCLCFPSFAAAEGPASPGACCTQGPLSDPCIGASLFAALVG